MLKDQHGNRLECIFPGCGKPLGEKQLSAGRATCSAECFRKFKDKYGLSVTNAIEAFLRGCPPSEEKRITQNFNRAMGNKHPEWSLPVMRQAGVRRNIAHELRATADKSGQ